MPTNTPNLKLYKVDGETDGSDTFNVDVVLNDNWDKIDAAIKSVEDAVGDISIPDASLTKKGVTMLSNATDGTREDVAATEKAAKAAYDKGKAAQDNLTTHLADYVKHLGIGTTTNTGNAYAVTLNPAPSSYANGMGIVLTVNADSTAAATINVNGLGPVPIKKANGNPVTNLKAGGVYTLRYSTAAFILQGEGGGGTATAAQILSGATATTDAGDIVGTMPNRSGVVAASGASQWPDGSLAVYQQQGYYGPQGTSEIKVTPAQLQAADADLNAANIRAGVNIFGVIGSLVEGKRSASGTATSTGAEFAGVVTITGLSFAPSIVYVYANTSYYAFAAKFFGGVSVGLRYASGVSNMSPTFSASGCIVPVAETGRSYQWVAFE